MDYEVELEQSSLFDLRDITFYEMQFSLSIEKSRSDVHSIVDKMIDELKYVPSRYPEREFGFTKVLRRAMPLGKYTVFYWIEENAPIVHVERVLHSRADFGRIHFGNRERRPQNSRAAALDCLSLAATSR